MSDEVWESFAASAWVDLAVNAPGARIRNRANELAARCETRGGLTRLLMWRTAAQRTIRGAEGAEIVGQRLGTLDVGWYLLNDVPLPDLGREIAHLLIGPGGVYVVTPASHPGKKVYVSGETTLVNGFRHYTTRTSRALAARASQQLTKSVGFDVDVTAVVAVVSAKDLLVRDQPRDGRVHVTSVRDIHKWIRQQPTQWGTDAVERIFAMARRSTTWENEDAWLVDSLLGY
jgi:hypothetical protein